MGRMLLQEPTEYSEKVLRVGVLRDNRLRPQTLSLSYLMFHLETLLVGTSGRVTSRIPLGGVVGAGGCEGCPEGAPDGGPESKP
mmetsp:Transcript_5687/g.13764  ORF Transcript_5687/g.13764 Transcript_5687/m.13764 type:complete len:84 (-) Transcript_5687:1134-1385(-)